MPLVGFGECTIACMDEPFSVVLTNESQSIPTDENRKVIEDFSFYTDINVKQGTTSYTNYTIGDITSSNGITVKKTATKVIFSVRAKTTILADSGTFVIPINIGNIVINKIFSWSCQKDGAAAKSVKAIPSSTIFKSVDGGETFYPDVIRISPIFQGGVSFSKWQYSLSGDTWEEVINGEHGFTISSSTLIIAKTCDLYSDDVTAISFKCLSDDDEYYDITTITKIYDVKGIEIGGRNYISFSSGEWKKGFFKNFNKVENGYGEHTLTSKNTYAYINLEDGFILGCRDYKVGREMIFSYDFMYTDWNFPEGTNRAEFWIGQRYTKSVSGGTSNGAWRGVTKHDLPVVGKNGCKLDVWYHVEKKITIPEPADEGVDTNSCIQFYNSNSEKEASITFRIKNVKLEYGNKATDWTPAPEDNTSSISDVEFIVNKLNKEITSKVEKTTIFDVTDENGETKKTLADILSSSTQDLYGFKREVKQQYDDLEIGGVNLFVQNTVTQGKYLSAENVEITDELWGYSDYIDVSSMDYYVASGFANLGDAHATCFYNNNKVFLSAIKSEVENSKESKRRIVQIPSGACYMRFSFVLTDIKTLKIEKGTKSTSYSPSPDDVAHNIKSVEEQTAEMFSWLIESDSSSTSLKITQGLIEAITNKFVIKGVNGEDVVIENGNVKAESITSDMITTDALKSRNYISETSGSFLNLADGSFDSKYFKWDNEGKVVATNGIIAGWNIDDASMSKGKGWKNSFSGSAYFGNNGLSITDKFWVDNEGNGCFTGNIIATTGKIGKFNIDNSSLITGETDLTRAGLGGTSQAFWAGSLTMDSAPFRVGYDGSFYSNKGQIGGWDIISDELRKDGNDYAVYICPGTNDHKDFLTVWDKNKASGDEYPFYVRADGRLHCVYGDIGGWNIDNDRIFKDSLSSLIQFSSSEQSLLFKKESTVEEDAYINSLILGISNEEYSAPYIELTDKTKKEELENKVLITSSSLSLEGFGRTIDICPSYIAFYNEEDGSSIELSIEKHFKIIWNGKYYMSENQSISLEGYEISSQFSGICLVFSRYDSTNNTILWRDMHYYFIPKHLASIKNGAGTDFVDPYRGMNKYIYIYNDKIVGHKMNNTSGTDNGLTYNNREWVLVKILGV